jgi:hypothetical protein
VERLVLGHFIGLIPEAQLEKTDVDFVALFRFVQIWQIEAVWLRQLRGGWHPWRVADSVPRADRKHAGQGRANGLCENAVPVSPLIDHDLVCRRVLVRDKDVVFVKGIFEASEGLGALFAERGGELIISAPLSRERELDELLNDLQHELQAVVSHLPLPTVP